MERIDDQLAADVFDFIDEYSSDRERGRELPLAHYLARYPRHQDAIAREYLTLRSPIAEGADSRANEASHASDGPDGPDVIGVIGVIGGPERVGANHPLAARAPRGSPWIPATGDTPFIGPYRLIREIGRGGQGSVFLADDTRIARRAAIKVLASRFDTFSDERLRRFRREADVIARLEHPNICGIYDADVDGPTPWIAMRFVEGRTLGAILNEAREAARARGPRSPSATLIESRTSDSDSSDVTASWPPATPLDVHRVLLLFERCARALHAAHEAGVVHRDIKPANIAIAPDGKPVLLDFGLARDEHSEITALTQSGDVFGTPAYMSPEQLDGPSDSLDRRTDVYSLGVSLYEALTLARPFDAPNRIALHQAIQRDPPPDPRKKNKHLSEDVKVVLETAIDKDRERRYRTALDFAEDLRRIREYEPVRARPAGVGLRFARWTRRHPALAVSIVGTILSLAGGLTLSLRFLARVQDALGRERVAVAEQKKALESALGRHLAERANALIAEDPSASLALAIDAVERAPNYITRSALFGALDACYLERVLETPEKSARRITDLAIDPSGASGAIGLSGASGAIGLSGASGAIGLSGARAAIGWDDGVLRIVDLASGKTLATSPVAANETVLVRWSADGRLLACASSGGELSLRSTTTGDVVHSTRIEHGIAEIELDADGSSLLAVAGDGRAVIWSTAEWRRACELDQGEGGIAHACFVPGSQQVLTTASSQHARARVATLWDARDGHVLRELGGDGGVLACCGVNANARRARAFTGSKDGHVRVYELADGAQSAAFALGAPVAFACFDASGSNIAAATDEGSEAGTAHLLNVATGSDLALGDAHGRKVFHAAFSPDGSRVATASFDVGVRIFRVSDGREERQCRALLRPVCVHWTSDGRHIVSTANALVAHVWSATNHPDVITFRGHERAIRTVAFSPDGNTALTASDDGSARVWFAGGERASSDAMASKRVACAGDRDALALEPHSPALERNACAREREPGSLVFALQHAGPVRGAYFSPDGETILTVSDDHTARLWNARTGLPACEPLQHPAPVTCGRWIRDGTRVLTISADGAARIFGARGGEPIVLRVASGASITCAAFDPNDALVAAGAEDDVLRLYDAASGALAAELAFASKARESPGIRDVAFHPGGEEVCAACNDNVVRSWSVTAKQSTRDLSVANPQSLCFSGDGARLLVLGRWGGGAVRVQDLLTNQFVRHPEIRHTDDITCGSFSCDGRFVLTGSKDATAYVWDAESGQPIVHRAGARSPIACAAFSADAPALRVITGGDDGTVSIWPVDPLPAAERRKPRDLYDWEKAREARLASPLIYE